MAYRIELGVDPDEGLYLEVALRNKRLLTNLGDNPDVDHRLNIFGFARDYGLGLGYGGYGIFGVTVASNSNGLITSPAPGFLAIAVPTTALLFGGQFIPAGPVPAPPGTPATVAAGNGPSAPDQGAPISPPYAPFFPVDLKRSLRAKLLAVPASNPAFTKTLATFVILLGGTMQPRITLDTYPLYPNAPSALGSCTVAQMKAQLAADGTLDAVQAALTAGPNDPTVITWDNGGNMTPGGPLGLLIGLTTGKTATQMALYVSMAALNPL